MDLLLPFGVIPVLGGAAPAETFKILLEDGDDLLAENNDFLIKE